MDYFSQLLEKEPKEPEETNGFFTSLRAMDYAELQIRTARSRGTFLLCYRIVSAAAQEESQCVGALRKHAGGMFLASDLGGYAAVVSICACTA